MQPHRIALNFCQVSVPELHQRETRPVAQRAPSTFLPGDAAEPEQLHPQGATPGSGTFSQVLRNAVRGGPPRTTVIFDLPHPAAQGVVTPSTEPPVLDSPGPLTPCSLHLRGPGQLSPSGLLIFRRRDPSAPRLSTGAASIWTGRPQGRVSSGREERKQKAGSLRPSDQPHYAERQAPGEGWRRPVGRGQRNEARTESGGGAHTPAPGTQVTPVSTQAPEPREKSAGRGPDPKA